MTASKPRTQEEVQENLSLWREYKNNPHSSRGGRAVMKLLKNHEKEINYVLAKRRIRDFGLRAKYKEIIHEYWLDKILEFDPEKGRALHYYLRQGADFALLREFRSEALWDKKVKMLQVQERDAHKANLEDWGTQYNDEPLEDRQETHRLWQHLLRSLREMEVLKKGSKLEDFLCAMSIGTDPEIYWQEVAEGCKNRQLGSIQAQLSKIAQKHPQLFKDFKEIFQDG